jgi:hypothetical protein
MLDRPDWILQRTSENVKGSPPFQGELTWHAICFATRNIGRCKVFSHYRMLKSSSPLGLHVESNEVIGLIPYLSPELIAAILKRESISAVDLQMDSKSSTEDSFQHCAPDRLSMENPCEFHFGGSYLGCDALAYLRSWADW